LFLVARRSSRSAPALSPTWQTDRSAPKPAKKIFPWKIDSPNLENKYAMLSHATWENLVGEQHGPNGFALHPTAPASEWPCKAFNSASHNEIVLILQT